ncbi:MAB_1171c family putative transporter [Pseudonocardia spinosispora]|uniref:MAB_1171c family putative transporter n=1 Tax=Pseudonocardia spinosispora TaxID=103441 RepID=UPI00316AD962
MVAAGFVALLWNLYRSARDPKNPRIWVVSGAIAAGLGEYAAVLEEMKRWLAQALGPGGPRLFLVAVLFLFCFLMLCFFLIATAASRQLIRLNFALWLAATVVIALCWRSGALSGVPGVPIDSASYKVSVFVQIIYLNYALWASLLVAWRYSKISRPPLSTGLIIVAVSLLLRDVSGIVASDISKTLGVFGYPIVVPDWLRVVTGWGGVIGRVGLMIGVVYPGVVGRALMVRRALRQLTSYRELTPLWTALSAAFPATTLRPPVTYGLSDWFTWRSVRRRYYRRAIECRDGLVQISPHLTDTENLETPEQQAAQVHAALAAARRGAAPYGGGVLLAAPSKPGFDADADALVKLSKAFAALASKG